VRKNLVLAFAVCLVSMSAIPWSAAQQPRPTSNLSTDIEELLVAVRGNLQSERADIMAKNLTLTSEQAAVFWPAYNSYQQLQNAIMDDQLKGIQQFIEASDRLDDAAALAFINGHLERDARMVALRQKWLGEFQKVVGTKLAVRVIQIDRRISLAHQLYFTTRIPLAQ
jgi:Spy/CpxP family protein refolding chaperone